ncbi:MAG: hypothetical protein ACKOEO_16445 [Planctomycetaceae bacterium]
MTNDNPFAAPEAWSDQNNQPEQDGSFEIIGQQVLCGRMVLLPPVCVVTGRTDDVVAQHQSLCFPWYRLVISQRWVQCHFFLHRKEHQRRARIRRSAAILQILGWSLLFGPFVLGLAGIVNLIGLVPIGGLLLLISRLITVFFTSSRLRLASTVNQRQSLICGFSPEFFKSLETLPD